MNTEKNGDAVKRKSLCRTPGGIRLGDRVAINGKKGLRVSQNGKEEDLLPEQLVEAIVDMPVHKIIYRKAMPTAR